MVKPVTVSAPPVSIAVVPLLIEKPCRLTWMGSVTESAGARILKTLPANPPLTVLVVLPTMVRSSVISMVLCRLMMPEEPAPNWMVSAPAWALASSTAWRREPGPVSVTLVTMKVAAVTLPEKRIKARMGRRSNSPEEKKRFHTRSRTTRRGFINRSLHK
ncbi:MAG: hypothetical protein C1943_05275 [Halochromatium sp.]|nr:hypothetical protein [Halochromatium sp.]